MDRKENQLSEISEQIETSIDSLVEEITKIASTLLEQHAEEIGKEELKVVRVS